jgi:GntR family transcriptional repressor for pyruvate dehydrogenase complex
MNDFSEPVVRTNLSDDLAHRIRRLIDANNLVPGDKLPTISELAERFEVGPPTLREALKKLETLGIVRIKHGSGIYVGENYRALFLSNPVISEGPSKKILLDLIEARRSVEPTAVRLAAEHATTADSPLTGIATEYIYRSGTPEVLPGSE